MVPGMPYQVVPSKMRLRPSFWFGRMTAVGGSLALCHFCDCALSARPET